MKKLFLTCLLSVISNAIFPQAVQYQTFIYTSDELSEEIQKLSEERNSTRTYLGDLFSTGKEAAKGLVSGYVTSFIDVGVNAIGNLLTHNSRMKKEWEEIVRQENIYKTQIGTVSEVNDFYKEPSFAGAMDPKGMKFDGIG